MEKTKPEFILLAGDKKDCGDLINDKYIYLTEEEYLHIKKYLIKRGAIDKSGERIDGKAEKTQYPLTKDTSLKK